MATKLSNETVAKRLVNARKEQTRLDEAKTRAEETIRTYELDVIEVAANVEHFSKLATARGLSEDQIATLGVPTVRAKADVPA